MINEQTFYAITLTSPTDKVYYMIHEATGTMEWDNSIHEAKRFTTAASAIYVAENTVAHILKNHMGNKHLRVEQVTITTNESIVHNVPV